MKYRLTLIKPYHPRIRNHVSINQSMRQTPLISVVNIYSHAGNTQTVVLKKQQYFSAEWYVTNSGSIIVPYLPVQHLALAKPYLTVIPWPNSVHIFHFFHIPAPGTYIPLSYTPILGIFTPYISSITMSYTVPVSKCTVCHCLKISPRFPSDLLPDMFIQFSPHIHMEAASYVKKTILNVSILNLFIIPVCVVPVISVG